MGLNGGEQPLVQIQRGLRRHSNPTRRNGNPMNTSSTILVIDDDRMTREYLNALLEHDGYSVEMASNGAEGLEMAARLLPDVILLDVIMPGMDGFDVCRQLRTHPLLGEAPIILITALDDRQARLHGFDAGADDFISKPFDRMELRARIRTTVRLNRYRKIMEERSRVAQIIELAPNGIMVVDVDGLILLANPAMVQMLGCIEAAQCVGKNLLDFLDPHVREESMLGLRNALTKHHMVRHLETLIVNTGGERIPIELDVACSSWQGQPALQISVRDITDRKRAELLEEDQRHVAYELHDGLAQLVASTHQHLQALAHISRPRSAAAQHELELATTLAHAAVKEVRRLLAGMRPSALDDFGLAVALRMQVDALRAEGWEITYSDQLGRTVLTPNQEMALFRIAQEALTNVRKHADAGHVRLVLQGEDLLARMEVVDDGKGFDLISTANPAGASHKLGLRGMQERITLVGGQLTIDSRLGEGTRVIAEIPLTRSDESK
jgi:PAS domain S-box-containing protein